MQLIKLTPKQSLNKAFLKTKPSRASFEAFKAQLLTLLEHTNETESEEFHKNLVSAFLRNSYYGNNYFINTKERADLVVHNGSDAHSTVGVIVETKKPTNKHEMLRTDNINAKAFHELILYFLRERITNNNVEVRHLIATNVYEWFVFDAHLFERVFCANKKLIKQFHDFSAGRLSGTTTEFFFKDIAEPALSAVEIEIPFAYFNLRDYEKLLRSGSDDPKLIALYKLLSPQHLLKLPFANDSNSLDKRFYAELLHIIGLVEDNESGKKLIERKPPAERESGSLLENTITQIDTLDKLHRIRNPDYFGSTKEERLFNVSLALVITWINRILFLKLLEAQLIAYNRGDHSYSFLNTKAIRTFDDLNTLFFQVLARRPQDRTADITKIFAKTPYLNSSLFEPTEIEHHTIFLSNLQDNNEISLFKGTVLKDNRGKPRTGKLHMLDYLFAFLDAYDFSSEGTEQIQEDNKSLINAAVLGLIFEKINGYRDGSFFTPGFITMYMCRETLRRAVLDKFNHEKGWHCSTLTELYNKIEDRDEANRIINALTVCDPAVGSGHFLVSALNELIAIKHYLRILQDRDGKRLKEYQFEVVNDELVITDDDNSLFTYNPNSIESQRVQEALFHEKQTIIENCLFGVDINPNSVKICRLRLWIELLKHAYYKSDRELETLPNIDINIKYGNSLVSRFDLKSDLKPHLKKHKFTLQEYRTAVATYRNATSKEQKRQMEDIITEIKTNFRTEISNNDPKYRRLITLKDELNHLTGQHILFEESTAKKRLRLQRVRQLERDIGKLKPEIESIKSNKIFENAFEWRFEFPEALTPDGDFEGFDCVIANPPYIYRNAELDRYKPYFKASYFNTSGNFDLYKFFIERAIQITKPNGYNSFITNSSFLLQTSFEKTRAFIIENAAIKLLAPLGPNAFDEAVVDSAIYVIKKVVERDSELQVVAPSTPQLLPETPAYTINQSRFYDNPSFVFDYLLHADEYAIVRRLESTYPNLEHGYDFGVGINTGYIKDDLVADSCLDDRYHPMISGTGVSRYKPPVTKGYIMYDAAFVKSKGTLGRALPDERFFTEPKILVVRTRNLSLATRLVATIDYVGGYNLNRLSNIIAKPGYKLEGLLGVLNSSFFNWLYSKRYYDYEIKPVYLRNSPLCDTNDEELNRLVVDVLRIKKDAQPTDTSDLERAIDKRVYFLYGLSDDEVSLIESSFNASAAGRAA